MTVIGLLTALVPLVTLTSPAFAKVNRNAGRSHHGGMGIDLDWYCKKNYGSSEAVKVNNSAYGWRCVKGNQLVGVSMRDVCKAHYGNTAVPGLAARKKAEDWYCILGLNLSWYCRQKYNSSSKAVKLSPNDPRSWKCKVGGNYYAIKMSSACKSHYGSKSFARLGVHSDPQAWTCEIR
ncbi:MAG: hypothetical protein QNJ47_23505 [Nostocaceae cyanobacterium]|nr:hypothetical protein [Nostocaceae cyanobacterium]